jgi:hypothetical protein
MMSTPPDWDFWVNMPEVELWQAPALSLGIDPEDLLFSRDGWMDGGSDAGPYFEKDSFPSDEIRKQYRKRLSLLQVHCSNQEYFRPGKLSMSTWYRCTVHLSDFAAWAKDVMNWAMPHELAALAVKQLAASNVATKSAPTEGQQAPKLRAQEFAILETLKSLESNPKALVPNEPGRPGVKAACKKALSDSQLFDGATTFNKAWERLAGFGDIEYSK